MELEREEHEKSQEEGEPRGDEDPVDGLALDGQGDVNEGFVGRVGEYAGACGIGIVGDAGD